MEDKSWKVHLLPAGLLLWILHSAMVPEVLSIDTSTDMSYLTESSALMSSTEPSPKSTDPSPTPTGTSEDPSTTYNETAPPTMLNENYTSDPITGQHFSCQTFHCMENDCYKNQSVWTGTSDVCTHASFCELYRHSSTHYEAKCSQQCTPGGCLQNGAQMDNCTMFCCNTSMCLTSQYIQSAGSGSMSTTSVGTTSTTSVGKTTTVIPPTTTTVSTTATPITTATTTARTTATTTATTTARTTAITTAITTATTIANSGLKCRSFKCTGSNCFVNEVNATIKFCRVGISHCELQKIVGSGNAISYEGGCSDTCATSKSSCASIQNGNCFQECCNATKTGCCMILDGQMHFNTAMHISRGSIWKLFSLALIVVFTSRFFSSI